MKLKDLPVGAIVEYPKFKYLNAIVQFQVVAKEHHTKDSGYPKNAITLQTKDIITNKAFDAKEASNSNSDRRNYGNNNYFVSNISQWLTSSATNWFKAQHGADAAPNSTSVVSANPYAAEAGFLSNMPEEFRDALLPTTLTTVQPSVDGGGVKKEVRTVFLPSRTEVGLGDEVSGSPEGAKWDFYTDNNSRKKVRTPQATNQATSSNDYWWLRTPFVGNANNVRLVHSDGTLNYNDANYGSDGVPPALNLSSDLSVSAKEGASGVYNVEFNAPPAINTSEPDNKGDVNIPFSVSYNVTDKENDKTKVVEKLNDTIIREIPEIVLGQQQNITISPEQWDALPMGQESSITITATAANGGVGEKVIKFRKTNNLPTITLTTENNKVLNHESQYVISGTSNDKDIDDAVTTYYSVNKGNKRVISSMVSTNSPVPYSKILVMRTSGETAKLFDGQTEVATGLKANTPYTIDVWAEDNHGGKSVVMSRAFTVVPNRPPTLEITSTPTGSDMLPNDDLVIKGNAEDPDGDVVKLTYQVGLDGEVKTTTVNSGGDFEIKIKVSDLSEGSNIVTVTAKDTYDYTAIKQIRITNNVTKTNAPTEHLIIDLNTPPESVSKIDMWTKYSGDADIEAVFSTGEDDKQEEVFVEFEKNNVTSPTGFPEYHFKGEMEDTKRVAIKFTATQGLELIIGGLSRPGDVDQMLDRVASGQLTTMRALVGINKDLEELKNQ